MSTTVSTGEVSRWRGALSGVLSVLTALGFGHLAAGLINIESSPIFAVGNAVIDVTPNPMKEFAIAQFGEDNKYVLLASMAVVLVLAAAVAGALSRRSWIPGIALISLLGAVAVLATVTRPTFFAPDLVAPIVSFAAGVGAFFWLHTAAKQKEVAVPAAGAADTTPEEGSAESTTKEFTWEIPGVGRRTFLVSSSVVAASAGLAGLGGRLAAQSIDVEASRQALNLVPDEPAPPIPSGADFVDNGTPAFITPNNEFYRVDTALTVPRLRAETWRMRIHGMVDREIVLTYDDLLARPLVEKTISLVCVSNEVGGPYISTANFIGVLLSDILEEAGVDPQSDQIATTSSDGWTCGTPVDVVMAPGSDALIAIGMNGEPLPAQHGFPVRMVVPGLYGFVSATKWLVDMELTTFADFTPYWVRRNWAERAPVKTMSRIDRPKSFSRVPAGPFIAAGISWAQRVGIDKVEVRVDGGPWLEADLSTEVNIDTWRMWKIELNLEPGSHRIQCRATDRNGETQTEERVAPIPDGATGWHSIAFTAGS
ncbi:molybdopterin-dependent oxidoreductase [Hoyosella rhizosphaerae]|uniref:Molybdopterin-binding protein n=1 Tax=Hoyosella rhizosphaerae TaxID=1755582 RepID=A0A916UH49_9ACTN|nr:molybdopterin-dependent oxidoreductase [Hoyosella rhizosphaerae]MBN4928139.1 molybdopterin-dependent oxidoreductase [Hoyosella rhizosphaerae]GGC72704.1 molybdopterin-binding protein [Hoyosella rhizosphaerae]